MRWIPVVLLLSFLCYSCRINTDSGKDTATDSMLPDHPYLVVLGTAQDGGVPQAGCTKACCEDRWDHPEEKLLVACLGIVDPVSSECWMVDATPDFPQQMHDLLRFLPGSGKTLVDGIFLTHGHIGHYTGLVYLGREAMGAHQVPVYAAPGMQTFLTQNGPWDLLVRLENIKIRNLHPNQPMQLNERIRVMPVPVPHRGEYTETMALQISSGDQSVLYIPDIDRWEDWDLDILDQIKTHTQLIIDGTFYSGEELPGRDMSEIPHPTIHHSMELFTNLSDEDRAKIHFTHFNHTNPVLNMDGEAYQKLIKAGFNIVHEGEIIAFKGAFSP